MDNATFTTPVGGHKVVLKTSITGRDRRNIQNVMLGKAKMNTSNAENLDIDGSVLAEVQDKTVETYLISVDGKTEGLLDLVLDMDSRDYEFVLAKVNEQNTAVEKKD